MTRGGAALNRRLPSRLIAAMALPAGPQVAVALGAGEVAAVGTPVARGSNSPPLHVAATVVLWAALALTVVSAVDYFYRFFRKADYRAIVPEEQRWS